MQSLPLMFAPARSIAILVSLFVSSCALDVGSDIQPIHEHQGTALLGDALDGEPARRGGAVNASGVPFTRIIARDAGLEARRGGGVFFGNHPEIIGAVLKTGSGVELLIDQACPRAVPPRGWRPGPGWSFPPGCGIPAGWASVPGEYDYIIRYRKPANITWEPLCDAAYNRALPVPGFWTEEGSHRASTERLSFGCYDGVVTKCHNWGYDLWAGARAGELHNACTRMANADYCAIGESNTLEWTPVDVFDMEPPPINPRVPGFLFEAGWAPDTGAVCLVRARWQTIPIGGSCGLPDPRVDPQAQYCEDYGGLERIRAAGALIFNDSLMLDSGLYRWNDPVAGEWFSSSRFVDEGVRGRIPPNKNYDHPAIFEGTVYSPTSPAAARPGAIALTSYRNLGTGDHYTSTGTAPAGYSKVAVEGYIFDPSATDLPDTAVPLNSYRRLSDGELMTTTASLPSGYALHRFEGYLLH